MKGYLITELLKGPNELVLRTDLTPEEPGQGEVQIRVMAAGLNFFDILQVKIIINESNDIIYHYYHI